MDLFFFHKVSFEKHPNVHTCYIHGNITFDISISLNGESPTMSVLKLLSRMWVCLSSPDDHDDQSENADDDEGPSFNPCTLGS